MKYFASQEYTIHCTKDVFIIFKVKLKHKKACEIKQSINCISFLIQMLNGSPNKILTDEKLAE